MPPVRVSAIVINYRRATMTRACLAALEDALSRLAATSEIIVVDNGSGDDSCRVIRDAIPDATLIELSKNRGFAPAAGEAIRKASGEWVLLVNNDVLVASEAVAQLLTVGESASDIGSVAAQMRFADNPRVINSAGIGIDRLGIAFDRLLGTPVTESEDRPVEVFGASGGAALHRRTMLEDVGGLDESFFFALDDADLAWRARMRGWRTMYAPTAVAHHEHGATGAHGSDLKYFHVGLNRIRTLAKNADAGQLRRYGLGMIAYDLAYVAFAAAKDRTLAPLRGRWRGLREWREYRRAGEPREPVDLAPALGLRAALARRAVWTRHSGLAADAHTEMGRRVARRGAGRSQVAVSGPDGADNAGLHTLTVFHLAAVSGPQRSLAPVLGWLSELGTVESVVPSAGGPTRQFNEIGPVQPAGYSTLTYPHGFRDVLRNLGRLALDTRALRRELRASGPDLVVVVTTTLPAALVAARMVGAPTVVYAAEIYEEDWRRRPLFRLWSKLLVVVTASLADGIVCCSNTVARQFSRTRGKPVSVAYPPIGEEYAAGSRTRGRERWRFADDDLCLVVVGSLSPGRGQDVAIRALPLVRERHPGARLLLVGDPHPNLADREYAAWLRELAAELDIAGDVLFAGAVDEVADVYAAADIVLNPARTAESFGRAAAEALLAGVPVVASRVGAVPEVLRDGVDALLVAPDDPASLATAAIRILRDDELRRGLVASGEERVRTTFGTGQDLAAWAEVVGAVLPASLVADRRAGLRDDAEVPGGRRAIARNP